jgi:hypothetical protein
MFLIGVGAHVCVGRVVINFIVVGVAAAAAAVDIVIYFL